MNWFDRMKSGIMTRMKREIPEGVWEQCAKCGTSTFTNVLERSKWICPECGNHFMIGHEEYINLLLDEGSFVEINAGLTTADPLNFRDSKRYVDRIKASKKTSNMEESICTGTGRIGGYQVAIGIMDARFIMGSLGSATGEKIARLIDKALAERRTLIIVCQSSGARMQESTYSLMQMAKVSAKLHQLALAKIPYFTVLTDFTYGGVTASFAMLGDVILAEPGARIGFAGPPVIKQFMGVDELPEGFQLSETVLENGFVDRIVTRDKLASELARLVALFAVKSSA